MSREVHVRFRESLKVKFLWATRLRKKPKVERYRFIKAESVNYRVTKLCDVLDVKRTSYYAWDKRPESNRIKRKREITELVIKNFHDNKRIPGSVKIAENISSSERKINRKLVSV